MEKISCIYEIVSKVDGKKYIGSAVNFFSRKAVHISQLTNNKHHSVYLQRCFNKYGLENFEFKILEKVLDKQNLLVREQYFIDLYSSYLSDNGFNMAKIAGSMLGFNFSEESKKLMSERKLGKSLSLETRKKMSETRRGRVIPKTEKVLLSHKASAKTQVKFSNSQVAEIRDLVAAGRTKRELMEIYQCGRTTLYRAINKSGLAYKEY